MLEDLLLGELALEQSRETQLDELAAQGPSVVAADEEAVARHLHRDGAEAFAHAHRRDIANDGTADAAPVDAAMIEEAAVLSGDERLLDRLGDLRQRDVDAAHDGQVSNEPVALIQDTSAFTGPVGAHFGAAGTTLVAAGEEPAVERQNSDNRCAENRELPPLTPHPHARGLSRWGEEALAY